MTDMVEPAANAAPAAPDSNCHDVAATTVRLSPTTEGLSPLSLVTAQLRCGDHKL